MSAVKDTKCTVAVLLMGTMSALHVWLITAGWLDHWWRGPLFAIPYYVAFRLVRRAHYPKAKKS